MSLDAYSPCPCGSGKKLKFCCQAIAGDIEKVERLLEGRQKSRAVQALEALERKHPDNPWVVTARAESLMQEGLSDEAAETLEPFVEKNPDHHYALVLLAVATFAADGFELAKPVVHRAFQRCLWEYPDVLADLAMGIAASMLGSGKYLSARAHQVLALRLASDEMKAQIFPRLMDFDGNAQIPYPLRSVHETAEVAGSQDKDSDAHKAMLLSRLGCWRPAARVFTKLAEAEPDNANLWCNVGLCRAWDGDETLAAEALHKAAQLQSDLETAVEWETVAQLLDHNITDDRIRILSRQYEIDSTSRLLSVLDEDERLSRIPVPGEAAEGAPAGVYFIVDDPQRLKQNHEDLTPDTVANVLAQISVFDAWEDDDEDEEQLPRVYVRGREGDGFESAVQTFLQAAEQYGGRLELDDDGDAPMQSLPRELSTLNWQWHFPEKTPQRTRRTVERDMWDRATGSVWPESPLAALGGKTPRQAAGDASLKVALRAALNVLDAYCDRSNYGLDVDALAAALNVEPPPEVVLNGQTLNHLTSLQLRRVAPAKLDDEQLGMLLQRAVLIHHGRLLYDVLALAVERPQVTELFGRQQMLLSFSDLCQNRGLYEESLRWIQEGRENAKTLENSFESTLQWVMRELMLRLEDPDDPAILPLLQHIGDYYLPKLPELREGLAEMVIAAGITPPWEADAVGAATPAGNETVWTPGGSHEPAAGSEKKLWLPGQ